MPTSSIALALPSCVIGSGGSTAAVSAAAGLALAQLSNSNSNSNSDSDSNSIGNVFLRRIGTRDSVCKDARNVSGDQNVPTRRCDCMQRQPLRRVLQNVLKGQNVLWMNFCLPPLFIFSSRNVSTPKTVLNNFSTNSQQ
jgi:hypothetical protein